MQGFEPKTRSLSRSSPVCWLLAFGLSACIDGQIEENALPEIHYHIEYQATKDHHNSLHLHASSPDFLIELSSSDEIISSLPLGKRHEMPSRIDFEFFEEQTYWLNVRISLKDGTLYQEDKISWTRSTNAPPNPVISFSSGASNQETVYLYVSSNIGPDTKEIWIEGDLAEDEYPEGRWRIIPKSGIIILRTSSGDGYKQISAKTRNIYGIESNLKQLGILIKSDMPDGCEVTILEPRTPSRFAKIRLQANEEGPLYYRVFGDTLNTQAFRAFNPGDERIIELTSGVGQKNISIQIRDEAGNYCLQDTISFFFEPDYNPAKVTILDKGYWTDDEFIQIGMEYPHFPGQQVEVYIFGDVSGENTQTWLPFADQAEVRLNPFEGQRWVRVRYRVDGEVQGTGLDGIYLRPRVRLNGNSAPYQLRSNNMYGLNTLSIIGCQEKYINVVYSSSYDCTPTQENIRVDFYFQDGSILTRTTQP